MEFFAFCGPAILKLFSRPYTLYINNLIAKAEYL